MQQQKQHGAPELASAPEGRSACIGQALGNADRANIRRMSLVLALPGPGPERLAATTSAKIRSLTMKLLAFYNVSAAESSAQWGIRFGAASDPARRCVRAAQASYCAIKAHECPATPSWALVDGQCTLWARSHETCAQVTWQVRYWHRSCAAELRVPHNAPAAWTEWWHGSGARSVGLHRLS